MESSTTVTQGRRKADDRSLTPAAPEEPGKHPLAGVAGKYEGSEWEELRAIIAENRRRDRPKRRHTE